MSLRSSTLLAVAIALTAIPFPREVFAQTPSPSQQSLSGTWLVNVAGESNTRTLVVPEPVSAEPGKLVGALYGLSGGNLPPVDAKLIVASSPRQLRIFTQASSLIEATEQPDGSFKGTFTTKGGSVREAVISRVLDGKLPQALPKKDLAAFVTPDASVPKECATFHGSWAGVWSIGGVGNTYLRVVEASHADGKCRLRLSYSSSKVPLPAREIVEFSGSHFSFLCNRSTNGTCVFKMADGELWAGYTNSSGGSNSAVFKRVEE